MCAYSATTKLTKLFVKPKSRALFLLTFLFIKQKANSKHQIFAHIRRNE